MLDYFKSLVKATRPDYIIDMRVASCDGLNSVSCKWAKGDTYYCASSFFTDAWISKNPWGPSKAPTEGKVQSAKLEDIAVVSLFKSFTLCNDYHGRTNSDMYEIINGMYSVLNRNIQASFVDNDYGDTFYLKIVVVPMPSVIITVKNVERLIGTIVISSDKRATPVLICDERLRYYVDRINAGDLDLFGDSGQPKSLLGSEILYDE